MKGISHFASGLCAASFVPGVVMQAGEGSLLIALGGACGMLPDFLDFRFARFLERRDADLLPAAAQPSAQALAESIAAEIELARASARPRTIQLHPRRNGVIDWTLYSVRFEPAADALSLTLGEQAARVACGPIDYGYDGALDVIELGGPSLRLIPDAQGRVAIEFLPWHRTWSHSLVLALALGVAVGMLFGRDAGIVSTLGYAVHVLEDQLGYMGSNLFWPLTRRRSSGLGLLHSGDTLPNALTVWLSCTLLLFNLDRALVAPALDAGAYLLFAVVLPTLVCVVLLARRRVATTLAAAVARERVAEGEGS